VGGVVNHQIGAYAICGIAQDYSVGRDMAGAAGRWYFGDNQAALQAHRFDSQALLRLSNEELIAEGSSSVAILTVYATALNVGSVWGSISCCSCLGLAVRHTTR
jgi:hypothetical protein